MTKKRCAIILAAGQGTRMKSQLPKVLHQVAGLPMLRYPVDLALALGCSPVVIIVGHGQTQVKDAFRDLPVAFVSQTQQLGSAHAVLCAESALKKFSGNAIILSGDVPLLQIETVKKLLQEHEKKNPALTLASFKTKNPRGYGRILRDLGGDVLKIVEETDLSETERSIEEVNGGLYVAEVPLLFKALKEIKKNPVKKEYYFTDLPVILRRENKSVGAFCIEKSNDLMGVNTRLELATAERLMQERLRKHWMQEGVSFIFPESVRLSSELTLNTDVLIEPYVSLLGKTKVGEGSVLEQGSILNNSILNKNVRVKAYSHLENCTVENEAVIGPFARIRPESLIKEKAHVGNFVELKKTVLGKGSKANHLSYLGDAIIGEKVNVGAGTITCNYDGVNKYKTQIESGVFIGSDTQIVAPVKIGKNAYVGAGTTVTKNVPAEALAISRLEQKNILKYSKKVKRKKTP